MPRVFVVLAVVLALLSPDGAQADAKSRRVRELFRAASTKYKLGRFTEALADFEAAFKLQPKVALIFNIAQCHRQLKHHARARFNYRLFLSEWDRTKGGKPPNYHEVREHIARLTAELQRQRLLQGRASPPGQPDRPRPAMLKLEDLPDGAMVLVDGVVRAQAPLLAPIELSPGEHQIRVNAEGYAPWEETISLAAGAERRQPVTLSHASASRFWLIAGIASAAIAAGTLGVGIAYNVKANDAQEPLDYDSYRRTSTAGYVIGGILAAAATASFVVHYLKGKERRQPSTTAAVWPVAGGAMAIGAVSF